MTGLSSEQVLELADRIEDYLGGWHPECGRRREMELFDAVAATLFYYRHDCSQEVTGVVFGVSQPTISRIVNTVEEPIAAVLDCEVPELVDVIAGRVVIPEAPSSPPAIARLTPSCIRASAAAAEQQSRFCRTPTAGCATSVNRSPDPSTT